MLIINGKDESGFIGKSVDEFACQKGFNKEYMAVEINGEILPRDKFDSKFNDGDRVEIVCFVGGG